MESVNKTESKRLVFIFNQDSETYKAAFIHLTKKDIDKLYNLKIKA